MGRLAVIGGHGVLGVALDQALGVDGRVRRVPVPGGPVTVLDAGAVVFLQRHAQPDYVLAHRLDHPAHAAALAAAGCDRVLAIASTGGLKRALAIGTTLVPDDFVALSGQPDSRFVDERAIRVPTFTPEWRARVVKAWTAHAPTPPVDGGVYWQTRGPRFETAAEVRVLAAFADVVGMTIGSECVACAEIGLEYAAVCVVDNLANGIAEQPLSVAEFEAGKAANVTALTATLRGVVAELAA